MQNSIQPLRGLSHSDSKTRHYLAFEYNYKSFIRSFVLELWRDLLTLIAVAGDLDFSEDITAHT